MEKTIQSGPEIEEDTPCAGLLIMLRTDENLQCVHEMLNSDRRLNLRVIADCIGIDTMAIITAGLAMQKTYPKLIYYH